MIRASGDRCRNAFYRGQRDQMTCIASIHRGLWKFASSRDAMACSRANVRLRRGFSAFTSPRNDASTRAVFLFIAGLKVPRSRHRCAYGPASYTLFEAQAREQAILTHRLRQEPPTE